MTAAKFVREFQGKGFSLTNRSQIAPFNPSESTLVMIDLHITDVIGLVIELDLGVCEVADISLVTTDTLSFAPTGGATQPVNMLPVNNFTPRRYPAHVSSFYSAFAQTEPRVSCDITTSTSTTDQPGR